MQMMNAMIDKLYKEDVVKFCNEEELLEISPMEYNNQNLPDLSHHSHGIPNRQTSSDEYQSHNIASIDNDLSYSQNLYVDQNTNIQQNITVKFTRASNLLSVSVL